MKAQEKALEHLANAWNEFLKIHPTEIHPDDTQDFRKGIHELQRILYTQLYLKDRGNNHWKVNPNWESPYPMDLTKIPTPPFYPEVYVNPTFPSTSNFPEQEEHDIMKLVNIKEPHPGLNIDQILDQSAL